MKFIRNLRLSESNMGYGNITFSGYLADVNRALSSVIYVPRVNWNSLDNITSFSNEQFSAGEGVKYRLSLYDELHKNLDTQIITSTLSPEVGSMVIEDIDASYFQFNFSCTQYAKALNLYLNSSAGEIAVVSQNIGSDLNGPDMQFKISNMIEKCNVIIKAEKMFVGTSRTAHRTSMVATSLTLTLQSLVA